MRYFYLVGAIISSVITLVLAFENVQAMCVDVVFFFYEVDTSMSPTFLIFGVAILGMITGIFFFGFLHSLFSGSGGEDEEDESF